MNIAVIMAVLGALLAGGVAGTALTNNELSEAEVQEQVNTIVAEIEKTLPEATDYVSVRPEIDSLPLEDLSVQERDGLVWMREEEKLARDVYITLYDTWNLRVFSNISQSEQTHTEAIRDLLVKYDITDPVADDTVGVFQNADLQELYDSLVTQGSVSELEAMKVGALIEDLDIADLDRYLAEVDNEDITLVYENLQRGSRNHLRAFMSQVESFGGSYDSQYISQADFDAILSSEREKGSGHSDGAGGHSSGSGNMDGAQKKARAESGQSSGQGGGQGHGGGGMRRGGN
jgi:hypothetical protein